MELRSFRNSRDLSLEQAAAQLGLTKGYLSKLETGALVWPIRQALEVEVWSEGAVTALELLKDADRALLENALRRARRELEPAA